MADDSSETFDDSSEAVIVKLVSLQQHAQQLLEATWRSDWLRAEFELNGVRMCLVAVTELAQLANDIQRGQIR